MRYSEATLTPYLRLLKGCINLERVPFSDRGSRLMLFKRDSELSLRLAERWFKLQDRLGSYRQREPIIRGWRWIDGAGQPLDVELTSYPHALRFDTAWGPFEVTFLDMEALYIALPPGRAGLTFTAFVERGRTDRRGGEMRGVRNIAYTTNARILSNTMQPVDPQHLRVTLIVQAEPGQGLVLNVTPRLGFNRAVPPPEPVFEAAARRWHDWFAAAPPVAPQYERAYYYAWLVMRSGLISSRYYLTREAMTPSLVHYVGVWQWDAFFHALAYRHVDARLAEDQLRVVLDHQLENGMIPDAIHDEGIVTHLDVPVSAPVTKPPLIAWTALRLYRTSGNRDFLDEIYEPIVRWNTWWFQENDDDGDGIVQYNHPNSSGLDDSPLWDEGMPVESPDLNTYLVLQLENLAEIAHILGLKEDAATWAAQADDLARRVIDHFWDEQAGVFWAQRHHVPIRVLTPFNLYPLITGRLPRSMADRLVAHLRNPQEFWAPYPLPTVALNDPKHNPEQMWRGPTWVNINYLFIEGLARAGYPDLARELRDRTLALLMAQDDFREYYHPITGQPPATAAPLFGWSAAVSIDLAIRASRGEL